MYDLTYETDEDGNRIVKVEKTQLERYLQSVDYVNNILSGLGDSLGLEAATFDPDFRMLFSENLEQCLAEIKTEFEEINDNLRLRDPLILDLNGDGVQTIHVDAGVLFDHDGSGLKQGTGWISKEDGFLVLDLNNNGQIDNGLELFGDNTRLAGQPDQIAEHGFSALKSYDTNGDGKIDAQDDVYFSLQIWQDLNQDGISQEGELKYLTEWGIDSISYDYVRVSNSQSGNRIEYESSFTWSDGQRGDVSALFFASNSFNSVFVEKFPISERAAKLPDAQGFGGVRSLREAASQNSRLAELLEQFVSLDNRSDQRALMDKILFEYSETSALDSLFDEFSRINVNPNTYKIAGNDWTKLAVIEAFGGDIESIYEIKRSSSFAVLKPFIGNDDLSSRLRDSVYKAYDSIEDAIYIQIALQTRLKSLTDTIVFSFSNGSLMFDYGEFEIAIGTHITADPVNGLLDLYDLVRFYPLLTKSDYEGYKLFFSELAKFSGDQSVMETLAKDIPLINMRDENITFSRDVDLVVGTDGQDKVYTLAGDDFIAGMGGDDVLQGGLGDDYLDGGEGADTIVGGEGDDILRGGSGSDVLKGGNGNDTYIYELGDGNTIIDNYDLSKTSQDILKLGKGILASDIRLSTHNRNLVITLNDGSAITLKNFLGDSSSNKISSIQFADGSHWTAQNIKERFFASTENNDSITGTVESDRILGKGGNDYIEGVSGSDFLDGGDGNDTLIVGQTASSKYEQNTLVGGKGDDIIKGYWSSDTYIYNLGDGHDVIYEFGSNESSDQIILGKGISKDQVIAVRVGDDITLKILDITGSIVGSITLAGAFIDKSDIVDNVVFSDGAVLTAEEIFKSAQIQMGTEGKDILLGSVQSELLYGLAGDDQIDGVAGNDYLDGGDGNDTLIVGQIAGNKYAKNTLVGGKGDDILKGHLSSETYIYNLGDGHDVIYESGWSESSDQIILGEGILKDQVKAVRVGDDITLQILDVDDKVVGSITLAGAFIDKNDIVDTVEFSDGTLLTAQEIFDWAQNQIGTDSNDSIFGSNESDKIYGLAGDDHIDGIAGNDYLDGGEGNDTLIVGQTSRSNYANNTLVGGQGNDILKGHVSSETYVYNLGDGHDVIYEFGSTSTTDQLMLGEGISKEQVKILRVDDDIALQILDTAGSVVGSITLAGAFS
ncbi:RTX toxin related Ca2+-binding protein, partial [Pseudoalteromonas luteoviolacea 2ta16]